MLLIRVRVLVWVLVGGTLALLMIQSILGAVVVLGMGLTNGLPASEIAPQFLQLLGFLLLVSVPAVFVKGRLEKVGDDEMTFEAQRKAEATRERAKASVERLRNLFAKQEAERISVGGSNDELSMLN